MNNIRSVFFSVVFAAGIIAASASVSFAQGAPAAAVNAATTVTYPIAELGSCKNKQACKTYCDNPNNMTACVSFAEKQGLLTGDDLRISKIVAQKVADKQTPGGCTTQGTCDAYCNGNVEHLNECLSFGEQLGVIPASDLAEAKKIASALQKGAAMPGQCKTKAECESYCAVGGHIDECLNFAEASGILPADELAQARKVAPFLKNGETPGKCTTKAECDAYCANDSHFTECLGFAEKAGFVTPEDAAMAKKTGGKGPGGCKGQDQCAVYCNDEAHADECLNFAKDKGLLTPEQLDLVNNGIDQMKSGLNQVPEEVRGQVTDCLATAAGGQDALNQILAKTKTPTKAMGEKFQACFANIAGLMQKEMTAKYQQMGGAPGSGTGAPSGAPGGAGGPPSASEIMKNLPANVPADMRAKIEQQIQNQINSAGGGKGAPSMPPGGVPKGAPNAEEMMQNIPAGIPADMRAKIQEGIQKQMQNTGPTGGVPPMPPSSASQSGGSVPPSTPAGGPVPAPGGMPPSGTGAPSCAVFANVPSCDYVQGQGHDLCVQCKGR